MMLSIVDATADVVYVPSETLGIVIADMDDGIFEKTYTSLNGIIVGGEESVKELVGSSDVFATEILIRLYAVDKSGLGYYGNFIGIDGKRVAIVSELSFAVVADDMNCTIIECRGINKFKGS